jgi:hypothetical protein
MPLMSMSCSEAANTNAEGSCELTTLVVKHTPLRVARENDDEHSVEEDFDGKRRALTAQRSPPDPNLFERLMRKRFARGYVVTISQ